MPSIPRVTKILLVLFVGLSLLSVLGSRWAGVGDIGDLLSLVPLAVWQGHVWRLVTYPWIAQDPIQLLFSGMFLYWVSRTLEQSWGSRVFAIRTAILVAVPAVLTTLLSLVVPSLEGTEQIGIWPLLLGLVVAFATELRDREIMLFPLPIPLSGDRLLMFEGVMLLLVILFSGSILRHTNAVFGFALGLAWFRFDVVRDLRRAVLRRRKSTLERKIVALRRERNLRVVRSDDEDKDNTSYLH